MNAVVKLINATGSFDGSVFSFTIEWDGLDSTKTICSALIKIGVVFDEIEIVAKGDGQRNFEFHSEDLTWAFENEIELKITLPGDT